METDKNTKDKVKATGGDGGLGHTTQETPQVTGRVLRGTVVSTKMKDTITVAVERYVMHSKYKKYQRRTKKFLVHDEGNTAKEGEKVDIREIRPRSKRKHFELIKG